MTTINHAVSMQQYDINMIVFTTQQALDEGIALSKARSVKEVRRIHNEALHNAQTANKFFDNNPGAVDTNPQMYKDFCDDCLIVCTTGLIGFERPIHLVHPSVISKVNWDSNFDTVRTKCADIKLDVDPNIPFLS